jgi:predicted Zn-dependent protease
LNGRITFSHALNIVSLVAAIALGSGAHAARGAAMIRDTEIENTIRAYAAPLLRAAALDPSSVSIHLIRSDILNAFVAGGQRLFLTTGLLRRSEHAGQVIGVMAHEFGHIAGGHLARLHGAVKRAEGRALISQILGVAVGVLARDPSVGLATTAGGMQVAERSLFKFSRIQESAADQAGIRLLDQTGQSARGMLEFLDVLSGQELLVSSRQDPYIRTHPLTQNRIAFVRNHVETSPYSDRPVSPEFARMHRLMVAKLDGFMKSPTLTLRKYKEGDNSVAARYARAIAYYRIPDLTRALPLIDGLIAGDPENPYFHELKGQTLFENGRIAEALPSYETAVRLMPGAPQLRTGLAHAQLELNRADLLAGAISHLRRALETDPRMAFAWRLSATAYGRSGKMGLSAWSQAEYSLLIGRRKDARGQAARALKLLKTGSPAWIRAQDIARASKRKDK